MPRVKQSLTPEQQARVNIVLAAIDNAEDARRTLVLELLAEGVSIREAAAAVSASTGTVQKWKRGE